MLEQDLVPLQSDLAEQTKQQVCSIHASRIRDGQNKHKPVNFVSQPQLWTAPRTNTNMTHSACRNQFSLKILRMAHPRLSPARNGGTRNGGIAKESKYGVIDSERYRKSRLPSEKVSVDVDMSCFVRASRSKFSASIRFATPTCPSCRNTSAARIQEKVTLKFRSYSRVMCNSVLCFVRFLYESRAIASTCCKD